MNLPSEIAVSDEEGAGCALSGPGCGYDKVKCTRTQRILRHRHTGEIVTLMRVVDKHSKDSRWIRQAETAPVSTAPMRAMVANILSLFSM